MAEEVKTEPELIPPSSNSPYDALAIIVIQLLFQGAVEAWNYTKTYSQEHYKTLGEKASNLSTKIREIDDQLTYGRMDEKGVKYKQ